MRSAIVIPACNAVERGVWEEVLDSVELQDFRPTERIVVDSGSVDDTAELAAARGWKVVPVLRRNFDHGLTRTRMVRRLRRRGFDVVIFMSQDVILAAPDALGKLVGYLCSHPVAGCFGRQTVRHAGTLGAWQLARCYPEESRVKTLADVPELKLRTPFFSNAFSAWKIDRVIELGGFPRAAFGEDMLLAAKVLDSGGAVGYCAEAVAIHEHPETPSGLFLRGLAVGRFHRDHGELLRRFGSPRSIVDPKRPRGLFLPFCVKSLGYLAGRLGEDLVPWLFFASIWLLLIPAMVLFDLPPRDVADRYAPMAEAFAAGDWRFAFHPRVTPLLPMLAGTIAFLLRCGGFAACQLAGALMLSLGVFPLYRGCRGIYGFRTAVWTLILYAGCSSLLRLGYYGVREPCGVFGVALLFCSAAELHLHPKKPLGCLLFAVAETVLLLTRGDVALFAAGAFAALLVWDVLKHRLVLRSVGVAAFVLLALSPVLCYNYRTIGYPVPEVRHAAALKALCRRFPALRFLENPAPRVPLDIAMTTADEEEERHE